MAQLGRLAIALLGILAYQNRDKLGEILKGRGDPSDPNRPKGGLLDGLSKGISGTPLGDILDRFRNTGAGSKVDSWVGKGPNDPIEPQEVESAIDEETLATLSRQTGLSREELIARLSRDLPEVVDRLTPDGRLPADAPDMAPDSPTLLDDLPYTNPSRVEGHRS